MGCADASAGAAEVSMGSPAVGCCAAACPLLLACCALACPAGQKAPMLLCSGPASGICSLTGCSAH